MVGEPIQSTRTRERERDTASQRHIHHLCVLPEGSIPTVRTRQKPEHTPDPKYSGKHGRAEHMERATAHHPSKHTCPAIITAAPERSCRSCPPSLRTLPRHTSQSHSACSPVGPSPAAAASPQGCNTHVHSVVSHIVLCWLMLSQQCGGTGAPRRFRQLVPSARL
jgi:hypothetical protein